MKDSWILRIKITAIVLILILIPLQYGAGEKIGPDILLSGRYVVGNAGSNDAALHAAHRHDGVKQ